jgi:hypothetical protein
MCSTPHERDRGVELTGGPRDGTRGAARAMALPQFQKKEKKKGKIK